MAGLPPIGTFPNFDQGLGRAKKGLDFFRENYVLGTLGLDGAMFGPVSPAAAVANTTVQAYYVLPCRAKIAKISVFCSAIAATTGTHSFNIVFGVTGAYTQGSIAGNDNSSVPNVSLRDSTTGQPTTISGGAGICTNPAVPGNALFAADVLFNTTNFPNLTTGTGTGVSYAQVLVPSSPVAVYPAGAVLTLRVTTPASTGSISNLLIGATLEPQPLSASFPAFPSSQSQPLNIPVPGVDF